MDYKIVFSDIDGTLLNKERRLSSLTKEIICQLQKSVPVVLISARMPAAMRPLQAELDISNLPLIAYNGGLVLDGNKTLSSTTIPIDILEGLLNYPTPPDLHLSLYYDDEWYVPQMDQWAAREINNTRVEPVVMPNLEVLNKWKTEDKAPHKIMAMGSPETIDQVRDFLEERFPGQLHLYRSKTTYLEIANKKVSKLTAVEYLLKEYFNLPLDKAVAFGDNYNDHEILEAAGMGIAVGNAREEILQVARRITDHSHQDGVARSLQQLFPEACKMSNSS